MVCIASSRSFIGRAANLEGRSSSRRKWQVWFCFRDLNARLRVNWLQSYRRLRAITTMMAWPGRVISALPEGGYLEGGEVGYASGGWKRYLPAVFLWTLNLFDWWEILTCWVNMPFLWVICSLVARLVRWPSVSFWIQAPKDEILIGSLFYLCLLYVNYDILLICLKVRAKLSMPRKNAGRFQTKKLREKKAVLAFVDDSHASLFSLHQINFVGSIYLIFYHL